MNLIDIGYSEFFGTEKIVPSVGRISFVNRQNYKVILEEGEFSAVLKGSLAYNIIDQEKYPVVGDWVKTTPIEEDKVLIVEIYPRKNKINRKVSGVKIEEQVLAANIDNVLICTSLNDDFSFSRIERYLFAFSSDVKPIIVLTKRDLEENYIDYLNQVKSRFLNVDVECVSIVDRSISTLSKYFVGGSTSVLVGSSGVGKSTLVNSLFGKELLKISDVNKKNDKGRHTTTFRQLIYIGEGKGCIVDTPGMRELSIWDSDAGDTSFSDIEELSHHCKFRDCTHTVETGCVVLEAVKEGKLDKERYKNYLKLIREEKFINSQKNYFTRREHNRRIKERCQRKKKKRFY
ncbi:ribosome small subunit-dependent GTPase A [Clostridium sp. D2Q-14]|uniref:ribosome small subunit-dependent GTPase A n=1 Tax=Anaeromonas gelatinilytica TaxID=2683194 RepID=UPI00193B7A6C|nr:ribosome small subunit-dependent GTPase A [Anaeromonas gelatinilytica]MBS4534767.1 ribosome small subunit-dependent GTPase A [Anaeromonas gelatinilytica]